MIPKAITLSSISSKESFVATWRSSDRWKRSETPWRALCYPKTWLNEYPKKLLDQTSWLSRSPFLWGIKSITANSLSWLKNDSSTFRTVCQLERKEASRVGMALDVREGTKPIRPWTHSKPMKLARIVLNISFIVSRRCIMETVGLILNRSLLTNRKTRSSHG